jgi:flagellar biosynthetic protein FliR
MTGLSHSYNLDSFLSGHVFAFVLLLARIGSVIMLFPGIGEPYVARRTRLLFAAAICLLLLEPMQQRLPPLPTAPAALAQLLIYELIIGIFFGTLIRMINSALEAAGMIIGLSTGLSNAATLNPAQVTQSPLPSAMLSVIGLILIFESGLDHFLIRSAVSLYDLFPAGGRLMPGDMAQVIMKVANQSFTLGIEMAAPFLIMGLLLNAALGLLQRLLPQIQLFQLAIPLQIWGGLVLLALTTAGMMTVWLHAYDDAVTHFFLG